MIGNAADIIGRLIGKVFVGTAYATGAILAAKAFGLI